eukprot:8979473-Alexandrium_andersonii.AAC.1
MLGVPPTSSKRARLARRAFLVFGLANPGLAVPPPKVLGLRAACLGNGRRPKPEACPTPGWGVGLVG